MAAAHLDEVRKAAAAGKHMLVEKPMAAALAQCDAMIQARKQAGVHQRMHDESARRARLCDDMTQLLNMPDMSDNDDRRLVTRKLRQRRLQELFTARPTPPETT